MEQADLWHETIFDAVGTAVKAAGGPKKIVPKLWPAVPEGQAAQRLRDAINPEHAQKLCLSEFVHVARLAKDAGDNSIMEFLARDLGYELKALAPADAKKRAKRARRLALLDELKRLDDDE